MALRAGDDLMGVWVSDPDAAGYFNFARAAEHVVTPFVAPVQELKPPVGLLRPSNPIGPTDVNSPLPPATALSSKMATVDVWTPNTEWGGGYANRQGTYLTIETTLRPPLELPRYSYAAIDSDALYQEAQRRVEASLQALYGKGVSG